MSVLVSDGTGNCRTFIQTVVEQAIVDLPGADLPAVEMQAMNALQAFCRKGYAYTVPDVGPFTLYAKNAQVQLDPVANDYRIAYVHRAFFHGNQLHPLTGAGYRSVVNQGTGTAYWYYQPEPGELYILPLSQNDEPNSVTVQASLIPLSKNVNLPSKFFTHYIEGVTAGTKERMMSSPKKPFTSVLGATLNSRRFESAWRSARNSTMNSFSVEAGGKWRYPQGWANWRRRR